MEQFIPNNPNNSVCYNCGASPKRRYKYKVIRPSDALNIYTTRVLINNNITNEVLLDIQYDSSRYMFILSKIIDDFDKLTEEKKNEK